MQANEGQINDNFQLQRMTGTDHAGCVSSVGLSWVFLALVIFILAGPFIFEFAVLFSMFGIGLIIYAIYLTQSE